MTAHVRTLSTAFQAHGLAEQATVPDWLRAFRAPALEILGALPLPTRKTERWRYSSRHVNFTEEQAVSRLPSPALAAGSASSTLVFQQGRFAADASSLPSQAGITITPFSDVTPEQARELTCLLSEGTEASFAPLLQGRLQDGVMVTIARGTQLDAPLRIVHEADGGTSVTAIVIRVESGASLSLIEEFRGSGVDTGLTGSSTRILLAAQAQLKHVRLSHEGAAQSHLGTTLVRQSRDSVLNSHSISFGGPLRRHDLRVQLAESGAEATVNGITLTRGSQHQDTQLTIEHLAPNCTSRETWRGLAAGESHSVFNGRILIARDAQKSSAELSNKNLLLSRGAEIDTKPELEIYADDVKCAHGATVGQLDHESLFYLVSRGIPSADAYRMLSIAFIDELLQRLPIDGIAESLNAELDAYFSSSTNKAGA